MTICQMAEMQQLGLELRKTCGKEFCLPTFLSLLTVLAYACSVSTCEEQISLKFLLLIWQKLK